MTDEANVSLRHIEHAHECNLVPLLRSVVGPQRHVTQAECARVIHRRVDGSLITWGVIDGGAREVWRCGRRGRLW